MRLCSGSGCLRKVDDGVRFCDDCVPVTLVDNGNCKQHTTAYTEELDSQRKSSRWQRSRLKVLAKDPLCRICKYKVSEIADHIVPAGVAVQQAIDSGMFKLDRFAGYYFLTNLQALCRPCHYTKTMLDKAHVGPWPDVVERETSEGKRTYTF